MKHLREPSRIRRGHLLAIVLLASVLVTVPLSHLVQHIERPDTMDLRSSQETRTFADVIGDWTIGPGTHESRSNETIVLKGNLTVQSGGSLSLDNVTLAMNSTSNGEFWIRVEAGGALNVKMSTVTSHDKVTPVVHYVNPIVSYTTYGLRYHFVIMGDTSIVGSFVEYLWGGSVFPQNPGGLEIYSDDVSIHRSTIQEAETHGIWIDGASPTIMQSVVILTGSCGIIADNSDVRIIGNLIDLVLQIEYASCGGVSLGIGNAFVVGNSIARGLGLGSIFGQNGAIIDGNDIIGGVHCNECNARIINNTITIYSTTGGNTGMTFSGDPLIENNTIVFVGPLIYPGPTGIVSDYSFSGGKIINNTIQNFGTGIMSQQYSKSLYMGNTIIGANESIWCWMGSTSSFIGNVFQDSYIGIHGWGCQAEDIANNTFRNTKAWDFYIEPDSGGPNPSHLVAVNNSFDPAKVVISPDSAGGTDASLTVENYLHTQVLDKNLRPLPAATVYIDTTGRPLQQRDSDAEGQSRWFRVPYSRYDYDSWDRWLQIGSPYRLSWFSTTAWATYPGKDFNNMPDYPSPRVVNMSSSHWEYFIEVGAPSMAELTVVDVHAVPNPSLLGSMVSVKATVRNWGLLNATGVEVEFRNGSMSGQVIGSTVITRIDRLGGSETASVSWTPPAVGDYTICAIADPRDVIPELNESDNGLCSNMSVVALPDLALDPSDTSFSTQPPFADNSTVQITANISNIGMVPSPVAVVRFHDGVPPSQTIDGDQSVGPLAVGGNGTSSVQWTSSPPGVHVLCAVVDPDDLIAETDETNNMACVPVDVLSLPNLRVASMDINPPSPLPNSTLSQITIVVDNLGDLTVDEFDVLLFDDDGDFVPETGESAGTSTLYDLTGHAQTSASMPWTASPQGIHSICAYVDPPPGVVNESNETDNVMCMTVVVQPGPVVRPDYAPVAPQPPPPIKVALSSPLQLSIQVKNQGNATAASNATIAFREPSSSPFWTSMLNPLAPADTSSRFTATWTAPATPGVYLVSVDVDYYNNVTEWDETNNVYTWTVEVVSGPVTSIVVGSPNYTSTATYVRSSTPLTLSVVDQGGSGINHTWFRIDNVTWTEYFSSFFLAGEGVHYVEWFSEDNLGNVETVSWRVLVLDDTPPATAITTGEPEHLDGGRYVTSSTPLALTVNDNAVGPNSTFYRLWGGSWSQWREYTASFNLIGRDGLWYVEFLSYDYLGNREVARNETYILDNTPPATTLSPTEGLYTTATVFTLAANDVGCGVNVTFFMVDGGSWNVYTGGFTLAEGQHNVSFYSVDMLNNTEAVKWRELTIPGEPPAEVEANYKPVVAAMFAIILLIFGLWSSRRKPWKGGKDRMAVAKAFIFISIPFILVEIATGLLSYNVEQLQIPPLIGAGTILDCGILAFGLILLFARSFKKTESVVKDSLVE